MTKMQDNTQDTALYLECYSGISGDMTVGALLDLGADEEALQAQLATLPLTGYRVKISRVKKAGLTVCDFNVILDPEYDTHDHDMAWLYGDDTGADDDHDHDNEHDHDHDHAHGGHEHRHMAEVQKILEGSGLTPAAKETALKIFQILAEAEAKAHGTTVEEVHFHEVGAVDSIVDIAAAAICLDNLGVQEVIVPELYEGTGLIRCQHGKLPVPVPAVVNIAEAYRICLHRTSQEAELVTPTGAAIVAAVRTKDQLPDRYQIVKTGLGAGKRDYEIPSILRAMLIQPEEKDDEPDCVYKLEANVDDCTGEELGFAMEQLMEAGARDVNFMPDYMKKNRPAYQLNVICGKADISRMEEIIFRETSTIGIRRVKMERTVLEREICDLDTEWGPVKVKISRGDGVTKVCPEYDSVAAICRKEHLPYREVWEKVKALALKKPDQGSLKEEKDGQI